MDQTDLRALAQQFMQNIVQVKKLENIWIEHLGPKAKVLAEACAAKVLEIGGFPFIVDSGSTALAKEISGLSADGILSRGSEKLSQMKRMQGYIRIKDDADEAKNTLPRETLQLYQLAMSEMIDYRVNNTRWLVVAAPTEEFAADLGMDFDEFKGFYRNVCLLDYSKMADAAKPLKRIMAEGKSVRIVSPNQETDLTFSIDAIDAVSCTGKRNIPDGECFTAPIKESVNGSILFGPSRYKWQYFSFIKLNFDNGRIVTAESENDERTSVLNAMLNIDDGARFVGEFAISFNPYVRHPTGNILFDEKIDGSIHMAMGKCYDQAPNGVVSANHWDMVQIHRPEYGGGEIWIDNQLIRKDGVFVSPELKLLNPENLRALTS